MIIQFGIIQALFILDILGAALMIIKEY